MGKQEAKPKEDEAKKEAMADGEDGEQKPMEPADQDGGHDDAAQDKELIMNMLKKHGALNEAMNEDAMQMAKEMYEAYKEMGYEDNEAQKCAAHSMKLARHMQGKQSAADQQPPVEGAANVDDKGLEYKEDEGAANVDSKGLEYKESKKIIELTAQVAKLTEAARKVEVSSHLEKVLKESKLSKKATDAFREAIGAPKSVEQIDRDFKVYLSAYKSAQGSEAEVSTTSPFLQLEKMTESSAVKPSAGLADCLTK